MKITAQASGGFSGHTERYQLDTACHADGKLIEDLLHQLDFFGATPACDVGADLARWEITVADGSDRHTVTLLDDGSAAATGWQALLGHLRNSA
jgi:hypothetical protein